MRLLVLTELFLPTKGGTAVWAAEVYRRLGGKELHIVTREVPGSADVDAVQPNTVHRLGLNRSPWLRPESLGIYAKFFVNSLALVLTQRFEAIHAFRALPEGLVAWAVSRLTFKPNVVYAHGEELTTWGKGAKYNVMRFVLRHAEWVIANSEYTQDKLVEMGVDAERIVLIYPGVDMESFRPGLYCEDLKAGIGLQVDEKLILSVGRLSRRKGFDMVIRSLPEMLNKGIKVRYALIGIGEDEAYLSKLAQELGVQDRVHFLGHVSAADLPRWYNACTAFAMPNREIKGDTEGFGIVFLEAAACGKPALAGLAGGTGAAVIDGKTGLRVEGADESAVSTGLLRLLSDEEAAFEMGRKAHIRAQSRFSWNQVAEVTHALFSE